MNINSRKRLIVYISVLLVLSTLLIIEYTYIHPYNPGWGLMGPRWTYISTKTITWWFLLFSSSVLITPLFRRQKVGFLGLLLFAAVLIRPIVQDKFPEETVFEFYSDRKEGLRSTVHQTNIENQTLVNSTIEELGFGKLIVQDSIYYFFCFDEEFAIGLCYTKRKELPKDTLTFGKKLKYREIDEFWYELDE